MHRRTLGWSMAVALGLVVGNTSAPVHARQWEGGGEMCQNMAFPPDGGDAICVDDVIAEIRLIWHDVFGAGTVYQLSTPHLTLWEPFNPVGWNAGQNHVGAQFEILPTWTLQLDFNEALARGEVTQDQFNVFLS
jgi:hypothetical protein